MYYMILFLLNFILFGRLCIRMYYLHTYVVKVTIHFLTGHFCTNTINRVINNQSYLSFNNLDISMKLSFLTKFDILFNMISKSNLLKQIFIQRKILQNEFGRFIF